MSTTISPVPAAAQPAPRPPAAAAPATNTAPPAADPATQAPPAPAGPNQLKAGQTETLGNSSDATVGTVTVGHPVVTTQPTDPSYGERPANGWHVIVKVTATADAGYQDGWFVSPLDFHVVANGQHYDEDNGHAYQALTDAQSGTDLSATLAAGETVTGYIAFDVPTAHGQIVYAPNSDGQPVTQWSY